MKQAIKLKFLTVFMLITLNSFSGTFYIQYNRGWSSSTVADIRFESTDFFLEFENVKMENNSFFPDNSIIPNAFIKPLLKLDIVSAIKATTEPYYSIRMFYFPKPSANMGFGIDFIHFKVFVPDDELKVPVKGELNGEAVQETTNIHKYINYFNVSHGVNFLGLTFYFKKNLKTKSLNFEPYILTGIGPCIPHQELRFVWDKEPASYTYIINIRNYGIALSTGSLIRISNKFGIYFEIKKTFTHLGKLPFYNGEGHSSLNFSVFHIVWGITIFANYF